MLNADLIEGAASAAKYCGVSRRTIYNLVENGSLPAIRKGRKLFFRKSEIEAAFSSKAA